MSSHSLSRLSFFVNLHMFRIISTCLCVPRGVWDIVIWNVGSMTESITISRTSSRQQERDWHDLDIGHSVIDVEFWLGMFTLVNIHWYFYNFIVTIVWPKHDFVLSRIRYGDDRDTRRLWCPNPHALSTVLMCNSSETSLIISPRSSIEQ